MAPFKIHARYSSFSLIYTVYAAMLNGALNIFTSTALAILCIESITILFSKVLLFRLHRI
jgi:hypothetical protein